MSSDQGAVDQEALDEETRESVIAALMARWGCEDTDEDAFDAANADLNCVLSALAEAGYTVVKTDKVQRGRCPVCQRSIALTKGGVLRTHGGGLGCRGISRLPVPEGDDSDDK